MKSCNFCQNQFEYSKSYKFCNKCLLILLDIFTNKNDSEWTRVCSLEEFSRNNEIVNEYEKYLTDEANKKAVLLKEDMNKLRKSIDLTKDLCVPTIYKFQDKKNNNKRLVTQKEGRANNKALLRYHSIKNRCIKNNLEFSFTKSEFLKGGDETPDICDYCGFDIDKITKIKLICETNKIYITESFYFLRTNNLSVDRKSSNLGYTKDNIIKACLACNCIKNHFISYDDYKLIAKSTMKNLIESIIKANKNA